MNTKAIREWFDAEVSEFCRYNWEELHDECLKRINLLLARIDELENEQRLGPTITDMNVAVDEIRKLNVRINGLEYELNSYRTTVKKARERLNDLLSK